MSTFEALKKIDLHCHMDGSLSIETLRKLAENIRCKYSCSGEYKEEGNGSMDSLGHMVPGAAPGRVKRSHEFWELPPDDELLSKMQVSPDCRDLGAYLACFDIPLPFLCIPENFRDGVLGVLRDAARDNVIYMEVRFSPLQSVQHGMTCSQMIEAALDGLKEGRMKYGVEGNLILCGMRHMDVSKNIEMLRGARTYFGEGVCAVDMAGNEAAYPILQQREFFEEAKKLGIPFTIHAGECGSAQSVSDAVWLGASRIGHGIAAVKDQALIDELRRKQIPLEMCPVSNLQTRAVESEKEYPFRAFQDAGLKLTINTDNRAVSGTSLCREFDWLEQQYGLRMEEARQLTMNALDAAFADDAVKQRVWRKLSEA